MPSGVLEPGDIGTRMAEPNRVLRWLRVQGIGARLERKNRTHTGACFLFSSFVRCRSRTPALAVGAAAVVGVDSSPEISNAYTRESQADGGAGAAGAAGATEAVGECPKTSIHTLWQSSVHSSTLASYSDCSLSVPEAEHSKGQNVRHQHEQP